MFFALKLGFSAAAAGLAWWAKDSNDKSSLKWEGKIKFYDYIEGNGKCIEDVLNEDNGRLVETKIQYKDISGSVDMTLASIIPLEHLALVLKTDKNEYWSIEKNEICIHVQRSFKEYDVMVKLDGEIRNTPLVYSSSKQLVYLNRWGISESCVRGVASKQVHVNDVLSYLDEEETLITFSYLQNCKIFLNRLLNFIFVKLSACTPFFDYSTGKYLTTEKLLGGMASNLPISELMLMYKGGSSQRGIKTAKKEVLVGFFIRTNNERCWSFEEGVDRLYIQQSNYGNELLQMLNGKDRKRNLFLKSERYYLDQDETVVSGTLPGIAHKNIDIRTILNVFEKIKMKKNSEQDFVDEALKLMYYYKEKMPTFFTFYDCIEAKSVDMFTFIIRSVDRFEIVDVMLMSKVAYDDGRGSNEGSRDSNEGGRDSNEGGRGSNVGGRGSKKDQCLVIVMETNENNYWSFERVENSIHVQRSKRDRLIHANLNGVARKDTLEYCKIDKSEKCEGKKLCDFLEFVMDYQRGLCKRPSQNFVESAMKRLGCIK